MLRASTRVHDRLGEIGREIPENLIPEAAWLECRRIAGGIVKAHGRGWHLAVRRLRAQLACAVSICRRRLDEVQTQFDTAAANPDLPSLRDIFHDLVVLEEEFSEIRVDLKRGTLSIVTDSIVLEGIDLGRFEILLDWNLLGCSLPYEVVALDPNPAASSSDTTHPHVQGNQLCEGDGRAPIRQALAEGRLFDFFLLVRQVLQTYNSTSAYVTLAEWHGVDCRDCGRSLGEDERDHCNECGAEVCYDCSVLCRDCDRSFCSECAPRCPGCEETFCASCRGPCEGCGDLFCKECLTDDRCSSCRKTNEEETEDADGQIPEGPSSQASPPHPSVQPIRLGEAVVPA
jgi:hypothetical protein